MGTESVRHKIDAIALEMEEAGVTKANVVSWKYQQLSLFDQPYKEVYQSAARELAEKVAERPMSPTEIGEKLGKRRNQTQSSARKINLYLIKAGLQYKKPRINSKNVTKYEYRLTELGRKFGTVEQTTARNSSGTVYQIRWYSVVVEYLNNWLNANSSI